MPLLGASSADETGVKEWIKFLDTNLVPPRIKKRCKEESRPVGTVYDDVAAVAKDNRMNL